MDFGLLDETAHTNVVESFWSLFNRANHGTFHHISKKHFNRFAGLLASKYNICPLDMLD